MTPERWQRIAAVFHDALERNPADRGPFLSEACASDPDVRREVDALLKAHENAGAFGEHPVATFSDDLLRGDPPLQSSVPGESHMLLKGRRLHPFFWIVCCIAAATVVAFARGSRTLASGGGATASVGWSEAARADGWYVTAVDESGPAAGLLAPGDYVISLDGIAPISPSGTTFHRRAFRAGDSYSIRVRRDERPIELTLRVVAGRSAWATQLSYFVSSLIWCAVGLFIGFARSDQTVAQLACGASLATGLLFLNIAALPGPLWGPMHVVLGYHFFTRFPTGQPARGIWRVGLWLAYLIGGTFAATGIWLRWALVTGGTEAAARVSLQHAPVFALRLPVVSLSAYIIAIVGSVGVIVGNYRNLSDPDQQRRVRWVVVSALVGLAPQFWYAGVSIADMAFERSVFPRFDAAVNGLTATIPVGVAYAIVRHRVLDIRVVVRRGLQYLLARRALQVLVAVPSIVLVTTAVRNRDRTITQLASDSSAYLYWTVAAALSLRFRIPMQGWLDRRFFREEKDREQMLLEVVGDFGKAESIPQLCDLLTATLDVAFHPTAVRMRFREHEAGHLAGSSGGPSRLPIGERLLAWLERHGSSADVPLPPAAGLTQLEARWLDDHDVRVIVPVPESGGGLAGMLMLGPRKSDEPYAPGDRRFLEAVASQVGVVAENLRLRSRVAVEQRVRQDVLAKLDPHRIALFKECPRCGRCFDAFVEHCDSDGEDLLPSLPMSRVVDNKYRLERLIGKGGMGSVYEARDLRLDRTVAIKVLHSRAFGEPRALQRFRREARAAAQLSHPRIVNVLDFGALESQVAYIVMERLQGWTLRAELDRLGILAPAAASEWFDQILDGLTAAHARGVVHRDLKPENVIGGRDGAGRLAVKIVDFGLAKVSGGDMIASGTLTGEGSVLGTLGYMSPEQLLGEAVDERSDLFAVGVMVAEAITGRRPFTGGPSLTRAVLHEEYHLPGASSAIRAIDHVVQGCLAKDPEDRYGSAAALRSALVPSLLACRGVV